MRENGTIKICGLKTEHALEAALAAGAEMIGLVFFEKSPRHVDLETAVKLADRARGRVEVVVLTVNADDALIDAIVASVRPDWLQLHGHESAKRCADLGTRHPVRIMKALGVSDPRDLDAAAPYVGVVDRVLFDAKPPKQSVLPGGNGVSFDWRILQGLDLGVPLMLSGGLEPGNVSGVDAIDVSSGVERARGEKDPELIRQFIEAARAAWAAHKRAARSSEEGVDA